jgi:tetratricopeptide (TPR) repeat protein
MLTFLLGALQACSSFPHIVVLHDPLTPEEHATLGATYEGQGFKEMAAREYQAALHQQDDFTPALIGLGNLSFESGALREAEDYYRRALDAAPYHPGASNNLAMVYLSRGERLDEAERLARIAVEQAGPLRPYILDTLAKIYARTGRYQEAKAALAEAEAAAPSENKTLRERLAQSRQELAAVDSRAP